MRSLEARKKEIDGVTYVVKPLTTKASLRVLARVLKMAAPAFGDVASLRAAARAATSSLGALFAGLAGDLDEAILLDVCDAFSAVTDADLGGKRLLALGNGQWDEHFRGRLFELFEWIAFAAEVTYGPLYVRLQAADPEPDETPAAG